MEEASRTGLVARWTADRLAGHDWVWPLIFGVLTLAAHLPLFGSDAAPNLPDARSAEQFFFEPHQSAPALILAVVAWLLWRRRERFLALEPDARPVPASILAALSVGFAIWARLNDADDLLVFSLAFLMASFAFASRGAAGCRALAVPLVVLAFALPVPGRLQNELIWHLQLLSAGGAEGLLALIGADVARDGLLLTRGDSGFLVIESCSGFRSIHILLLVSIVLRDLFDLGRRGWTLLLVAAPTAMVLNVLRIVWIVLSAEGDASAEEHVGQGLAVLIAGSVLLFGLAWALDRSTSGEPAHRPDADELHPVRDATWRRMTAVPAILCAIPFLVDPWPFARREPIALDTFFEDTRMWTGRDLDTDRIFIGSVGIGRIRQREMTYAGSRRAYPGEVELFVGLESRSRPRWSPFSDLLLLPARGWGIAERRSMRDWRLFRDVDEAVVTRGEDVAIVRSWRIGDRGLLVESLRSLLALERGPFARDHPRAVVRLVVAVEPGIPKSVELGRERLDQLVIDYADDFEALEP